MIPFALSFVVLASASAADRVGQRALPSGDPSWAEQDVIANDGAIDDRFGTSVAVSGDVAVIGSADAKIGDNYSQGAAYVFTRQAGVWTETQKLVASNGAGMANFGQAVAIDGDTIFVGAVNANVGTTSDQGAVYVFQRSGDTWSETQILADAAGGLGDLFGNSIVVRNGVALIGAKGSTIGTNTLQGRVYVFTATDGTWSQQQVLTADDGSSNDLFGTSVALDGDTALIGAPTLTYNFQHAGFAYVFKRSGDTWSQSSKIIPDDSQLGDQFGYAVGLSNGTALITTTGNQFAHGAFYAFDDIDGTWTQRQKTSPDDGAGGDEFGNVLAMSGGTAVIGAQRLVLGDHQGAAYVFDSVDGTWTQSHEFTEATGTSLDFFGGAVAFDGSTAVVGVPGATIDGEQFQGSAAFYAGNSAVADDIFCSGFESDEAGACAAAKRARF